MTEPNFSNIPSSLVEMLAELKDCLCTEVNDVLPVCSCTILPGQEVAWDYCGECEDQCGQAWLRVVRVFPYEVWPNPSQSASCDWPLAVQVEVGVIRCLPTFSEAGELPSLAEIEEVSMLQAADMWAMLRAISCCSSSYKSPGQYQAVGPTGGCVGGTWSVLVALD